MCPHVTLILSKRNISTYSQILRPFTCSCFCCNNKIFNLDGKNLNTMYFKGYNYTMLVFDNNILCPHMTYMCPSMTFSSMITNDSECTKL